RATAHAGERSGDEELVPHRYQFRREPRARWAYNEQTRQIDGHYDEIREVFPRVRRELSRVPEALRRVTHAESAADLNELVRLIQQMDPDRYGYRVDSLHLAVKWAAEIVEKWYQATIQAQAVKKSKIDSEVLSNHPRNTPGQAASQMHPRDGQPDYEAV